MPTTPATPIPRTRIGADSLPEELALTTATAYTGSSGSTVASRPALVILPDGALLAPGGIGAIILGDTSDAIGFFGGVPSPKVTVVGDVLPLTPPVNNPVDLDTSNTAVAAFAGAGSFGDVDTSLEALRVAVNALTARVSQGALYHDNLAAAVNSLVTSFANAINLLETRTDVMERYGLAAFPDS